MSSKIKSNSSIIFTLVFIITLVIVIFIVHNHTNTMMSELTTDRTMTAKQGLLSYFEELKIKALQRAELIASRSIVIDAVENGDYGALSEILPEYSIGVDFVSFCDPDGMMIFHSYDDSYGDDVSGQQDIAYVLHTSRKSSSISVLPNGRIAASASAPVLREGKLLGIINCSIDLTDTEYLETFKERTGCEATIFIGSTRVSTTLTENGVRLTGTTADDAIVNKVLIGGDSYLDIIAAFGGMYGVHYSPLISGGHTIGMLFTGLNIDSSYAGQRTMNILIIFASVLGIIVAVLFWIVSALHSRKYTQTFNELSEKTSSVRELNAYIDEVSEARESAETANSAKSIFIASMSRELRGPMSNILGFSELAQDGNISKTTKEHLVRISENAKWMLQVIDDIIDISKIETGRAVMEYSPESNNAITDGSAADGPVPDVELKRPHLQGEVLVCEDNEMNQMVICEHLRRVGLNTVLAENGREAVDIVTKRDKSGGKPFDLILMDIHMPEMNGMEAASKINELKTGIPIVAITANVMAHEIEQYKAHGIPDFISKPFTSQILWKCLLRYIKQSGDSSAEDDHQATDEARMLSQLRLHFVKSNRSTCDDIKTAVENGDRTLAHRLAHSLKSNAGQIGEKKLQEIAAAVENILKDDNAIPDQAQFKLLEDELNIVLDGLAPLLVEKSNKQKTGTLNEQSVHLLFDKLEVMLRNKNPECLSLLPELQAIPEAEELVWFVEDFEFRKALSELIALKERMDSNNAG